MKVNTETVHKVYSHELERFASEVYGLEDYCFVACEECGNDSSHRFYVGGELGRLDTATAVGIIETKRVSNYQNGVVLNMLCRDGHIEPGTYLVEVCW